MEDFVTHLTRRRRKNPAKSSSADLEERFARPAPLQATETTLHDNRTFLRYLLSVLRRSRMLPPPEVTFASDPQHGEAEAELQTLLEDEISGDIAFLRMSLENGKIFQEPRSRPAEHVHSFAESRDPFIFLLKVLLGLNQPLALKHRITLAIWFANAGARIDNEDEDGREIWRDLTMIAPDLANAVSPQNRSLKQLSALAVRSRLHYPLSDKVKFLPVPPLVQEYILRGFLDVDPFLVESLTERLRANKDIPFVKYQDIWYEICPPRLMCCVR